MAPRWSRPAALLTVLLVLFVALRLLQAASATVSCDEEDGFTMAAAWELLQNRSYPLQAYQISDWENGSLVMVLLAAPMAWLFGPSLFALKVAALPLTILTILGIYLLAREVFGARAGLLACWLYALFPGPVLHYTITAHGFHPDSAGLQVLYLWAVLRASGSRCSAPRLVAAGVVGGFMIYFAYISVFALVAGVTVLAWRLVSSGPPAQAARRLGLHLAGGLLGGAPLIGYNLMTGFAGLGFADGRAAGEITSPLGFLGRSEEISRMFSDSLLHFSNWTNREAWTATAFNVSFWLVAAVCLLLPSLRRLLRHRAAPLAPLGRWSRELLFDRAMIVLAGVSFYVFVNAHQPFFPWHFVPLFVFACALLAGRLAWLWRSGGPWGRAAVMLLVVAWTANGVHANAALLDAGEPGVALALDGRSYPIFFEKAEDRFVPRSPPRVAIRVCALSLPLEQAKLDLPQEGELFQRPGEYYYLSQYKDRLSELVLDRRGTGRLLRFMREAPAAVPLQQRPRLVGYVLALLLRGHRGEKQSADQVWRQLRTLKRWDRLPALEGLGFGLPHQALPAVLEAGRGAGLLRSGDALEHRLAWGMGRGTRPARLLDYAEGQFCGHRLPPRLRASYIRGVGYGMACRMVRPVPPAMPERICPRLRAEFSRGARQGAIHCPVRPGCRLLP